MIISKQKCCSTNPCYNESNGYSKTTDLLLRSDLDKLKLQVESLVIPAVIDSLDSTDTLNALSAAQGRVLAHMIRDIDTNSVAYDNIYNGSIKQTSIINEVT
jgi:hypothetical protein